MVWQLVLLPGTHTVTEVNRVLTEPPSGPASTVTLVTFASLGPPPGGAAANPRPPPPPQDSAEAQIRAAIDQQRTLAPVRMRCRRTAVINAGLPNPRRSAPRRSSRPARRMHAYDRPIPPPDRRSGPAGGCGPSAGPAPPTRRVRSSVRNTAADWARWGRSMRLQTPYRRARRIPAISCRRAVWLRAGGNSREPSLSPLRATAPYRPAPRPRSHPRQRPRCFVLMLRRPPHLRASSS